MKRQIFQKQMERLFKEHGHPHPMKHGENPDRKGALLQQHRMKVIGRDLERLKVIEARSGVLASIGVRRVWTDEERQEWDSLNTEMNAILAKYKKG
jgi:hypothetical protein